MFEAEGAPCGPTLRKELVTIGSADNFILTQRTMMLKMPCMVLDVPLPNFKPPPAQVL